MTLYSVGPRYTRRWLFLLLLAAFLLLTAVIILSADWSTSWLYRGGSCTPNVDRLIKMPNGETIPLYDPDEKQARLDAILDCAYTSNGKLACPSVKLKGETVARQLQLSVGRMLRIFGLMAEKYKFDYWLWAGTLIGARRDGLFIPWDHDADVHMMRNDFEVFKHHAESDFPLDVFLQTVESDGEYAKYRISHEGKIRDTTTCYGYCQRYSCTYEDGFQVDIVVFDNTTDGFIEDVYRTYKFKFTDIHPLQRVEYEGFAFKAPRRAAYLLRDDYGDTSRLPHPMRRCKEQLGIPWSSCSGMLAMNESYRQYLLHSTLMSTHPRAMLPYP